MALPPNELIGRALPAPPVLLVVPVAGPFSPPPQIAPTPSPGQAGLAALPPSGALPGSAAAAMLSMPAPAQPGQPLPHLGNQLAGGAAAAIAPAFSAPPVRSAPGDQNEPRRHPEGEGAKGKAEK